MWMNFHNVIFTCLLQKQGLPTVYFGLYTVPQKHTYRHPKWFWIRNRAKINLWKFIHIF